MVEYLKAENRVLRERLPARLTVTPRERTRLVKLGRPLGAAINDLITIVTPRTFARWVRGTTTPTRPKPGTRKPGRPRTADDIRELILRLARESGWGYSRVLGELKKLGIHAVSRTTVANILREAGLDPGPKRGEGTWEEFFTRQAATLWACDFLSVKSWTTSGLVDLYILFFLHVGSRRAFVAGITAHPDAAWVTQQARNASMVMADWGLPATHLLLDHDTKFASGFDAVFEAEGVLVKRVGPRAPNLNAYAERWVQTLKQECLHHFVILGEKHLRHLVSEFVAHYNEERPHQAKGNVPLPEADEDEPRLLQFPSGEVRCRERLGGLLKHYYRDAA
jgi:putative transposase